MLVRDLPPREIATWSIDAGDSTVRLARPVAGLEGVILPLAPMIGCFGVAPALGQAISTATSGQHGGNMDYRLSGPGTTAWFPVSAPGALLFLGDCHASQGDGKSWTRK
jgi:amidase